MTEKLLHIAENNISKLYVNINKNYTTIIDSASKKYNNTQLRHLML